jgi:hypothetical protein
MSKLQLSRKFVQEAYNAANSEWKPRITKEFPKLLQSPTLEKLEEMALDCYKLNRKDYKDFSFSEIRIVPADGPNFYVAVRLPGANIDWTLSAFAFIRHFVEYMKAKKIHTYPWHYNESVKAVSEKLGWSLSKCLLIYVERPLSGLDVDDKELFETSEEFVKEAHKAACDAWRKKIEEQLPELFEAEKTFPIGTRLIINLIAGDEEFMIVGIDGKAYAICVNNGMVWSSSSMNVVNPRIGLSNKARVSLSELQKHINPISFHIL